jgi:hypothetical protein
MAVQVRQPHLGASPPLQQMGTLEPCSSVSQAWPMQLSNRAACLRRDGRHGSKIPTQETGQSSKGARPRSVWVSVYGIAVCMFTCSALGAGTTIGHLGVNPVLRCNGV